MATEYKTWCDGCGKQTHYRDIMGSYENDDAYREDNWRVSLDNHWFSDTDDGCKKMERDISVSAELCLACSKIVGSTIKLAIAELKRNASNA